MMDFAISPDFWDSQAINISEYISDIGRASLSVADSWDSQMSASLETTNNLVDSTLGYIQKPQNPIISTNELTTEYFTEGGIQQINNTIEAYQIGHHLPVLANGDLNYFKPDSSALTSDGLSSYKDELLDWAKLLPDMSDDLLYGVETVAKNVEQELVNQFGDWRDNDSSAFPDLAKAGINENLDFIPKAIETYLPFDISALMTQLKDVVPLNGNVDDCLLALCAFDYDTGKTFLDSSGPGSALNLKVTNNGVLPSAVVSQYTQDLATDYKLALANEGTGEFSPQEILDSDALYNQAFDACEDAQNFLAELEEIDLINNAPKAASDEFNIPEHTVNIVLDVLSNNLDAEGDGLKITEVTSPDQGGTITIDETNNVLLYTPSPEFAGFETFAYVVSDGTASSTGNLSVSVDNIDDTPMGVGDNFTVTAGSTDNSLDVLANDTDANNSDSLTIKTVSTSDNGGSVRINETKDGLIYIPANEFEGLESFECTIVDSGNLTATTSVLTTVSLPSERVEIVDITNLPEILLAENPELSNAIPDDGLDDSDAIQSLIDWFAEQADEASVIDGLTIQFSEGVFDLGKSIKIDVPHLTFQGAGRELTTLKNSDAFQVGTDGLPDSGVGFSSASRNAYLFDLDKDADHLAFRDMGFTGAAIHGAILGDRVDGLEISGSKFNDFAWSSIRLFNSSEAKIYDNEFIDAGGQADETSGTTGGSIYATYLSDSEIYNNSISGSEGRPGNVYGIKGRQFRNTRIHHNTIDTNFAIELPFENDRFVEIDHNYLGGAVSIPKFGGGAVPEDGYTFHIHHNYFTSSYALEWARNGAEINHNVFVFDVENDRGNLISNFGSEAAEGPTKFHNNLIMNPGRGIAWNRGVYNNFFFYNNEIIANETITPRTRGLFGFNKNTDFSTIEIRDNVIQINGISRPLFRNEASYGATILNNTLVNVSDAAQLSNPDTRAPRGLIEPLLFQIGANDEFTVDGYDLRRTEYGSNTAPTTGGIDDITVTQGARDTLIKLSDVFEDRDTATTNLSYEITGNTNPALFDNVSIDLVADELTLDYASVGTGSGELTVRATDLGGLSVETTFGVTVEPSPLPVLENSIRIEAEDFKAGVNGIAYFDKSNANLGGAYRLDEPVDIEVTKDIEGGFNVGWTEPGEYLSFDVNVPVTGLYDVVARVATHKNGLRRLGLTFGNEFQRIIEFGKTGSWQTWRDVALNGIQLNEGSQELRVDFLTGGLNLNHIDLTNLRPFTAGVIHVEAEDYKIGTNGAEYYDTSLENFGGAYRLDEPVDIQLTQDEWGGFNVGWIESGEYLT